jgi:hypothetical protein
LCWSQVSGINTGKLSLRLPLDDERESVLGACYSAFAITNLNMKADFEKKIEKGMEAYLAIFGSSLITLASLTASKPCSFVSCCLLINLEVNTKHALNHIVMSSHGQCFSLVVC